MNEAKIVQLIHAKPSEDNKFEPTLKYQSQLEEIEIEIENQKKKKRKEVKR